MLARLRERLAPERRVVDVTDSALSVEASKNAVLLHGTGAGPRSGWLPWLENELRWKGYDVWAPQLPGADHPDMDRYWEVLFDYDYNERTVIVGHGSGAVAAFGVVQRLRPNVQVRHLVAVAPFYRDDDFGCADLLAGELDWQRIRRQARTIDLVWAPDDPLMADDQIAVLSEKLGARPRFVEGPARLVPEPRPSSRQFAGMVELIERRS